MNVLCPGCASVLSPDTSSWGCSGCGATYPATLGIPDLRGTGEPQIDEGLSATFAESTFDQLLAKHSTHFSTDDPALVAQYIAYRKTGAARGKKFWDMVIQRSGIANHDTALIVGCGSGSTLLLAARAFDHVVGIDPSLPELILAKKAAEEAGLNVTLIQGFAQNIPFAANSFDLTVGENVLEHVHDVDTMIKECARTLRHDGWFVADSANRYNLLLPEPHVKLMWVGFIPRKWQARYCLWRRGFRNYDRSVCLPSYVTLSRPLARYFAGGRIAFPSMGAYGFPPQLDIVCRLIEHIPLLAPTVLAIFPTHLVLATQPKADVTAVK
jgi:SAM-dependent methyltransferase